MAEYTDEQVADWEDYKPRTYSDDEVAGWEDVTSSPMGAALRRGIIEAPAGAAAGVAGVAAAIPGAAIGTPIGGPVGGIVGGLATGVPAAMAVGAGAHALQEKLLDMLGLREGTGFFSRNQEYVDRATNPYSTFGGELAGNTLPSFGVGAGRMVGQRVLGAGLQAGMEAGSEAYRGEEFDKGKIALSGIAGAVAAQPRKWMNPITAPIERRFGVQPPQAPSARPEDNAPLSTEIEQGGYRTGELPGDQPVDAGVQERLTNWLKPGAEQAGFERGELPNEDTVPRSDPTSVDPGLAGQTPKQQQLAFAKEQLVGAEPGAIRGYWEAHARALQKEIDDVANTRANDITTTSRGVAAENPPAPQIEVAGNPVGAPMQARSAQRPNGPARNYTKGFRTGELPEDAGNPRLGRPKFNAGELPNEDILSSNPIHSDVRAALEAAQPAPKAPEVTAPVTPPESPRPVTPPPPEPAPAPQSTRPGTLSLPQRPNFKQQLVLDRVARQKEAAQRPPAAQAAINAGQSKRGPRPTFTIDALSTPKPITKPAEPVASAPEHPSIAQARELLAKHPVKEAAEVFEKLPPAQQLKAAKKIVSDLPQLMENQRLEKHRKTLDTAEGDLKVQTGGGERDVRKRGAWEAYHKAAKEFEHPEFNLDPSKENAAAIRGHAKKIFDRAKELYGGKDPTDRTEGYRPNTRTPAYEIVAAARRVMASKPTVWPPMKKFVETLALEGKVGSKTDEELSRKQRPSVENVEATFTRDKDRPHFEDFDNSSGDEAQFYVKQQDDLRHWLNELSPDEFNVLQRMHPDMESNVAATQDPGALHSTLKRQLESEMEGNAAGYNPTEKRTPVKVVADIARIEAPKGRSIDPNSAEGKAILAGRSVQEAKATPKRTKAEADAERAKGDRAAGLRTPSEQFKAFFGDEKGSLNIATIKKDLNRLKVGATDLVARATMMAQHLTQRDYAAVVREATPLLPEHVTAAETAGDKDLWKTFGRMMGDESGALNINQLKNMAPSWMLNLRHSFLTPGPVVRDAVHDYANQMVGWFTRLSNNLSAFKDTLIVNAAHARFADGSLPSVAESKQIHDAFEKGTANALPGKLKDYADSYVKPLLDKYKTMYIDYKALMTAMKLPGWDTLPDPHSNGNGFNEFFPRFLKGSAGWETNDTINPTSGQSLGYWAATAQERGYFALQNAAGDRLIYTPTDNSITILRNGAPQKVAISGVDTGQVGNTLSLKIKGKTDTWTIDHAGRAEITKAAGKDAQGNDKFVYHDDPVLAMSNAIYGLNNATQRLKHYDKLTSDPFFQANQLPAHKAFEAREKGWVQTELPPWKDKGTFFPKHIAWTLDDFNYRGFKLGEGNTFKVALDKFAGDTAKLFYFFGPIVHAFNEADKWVIGRGWDNITPRGLRSLGKNGALSLKDSLSKDRPIEREMRDAGANLMYLHAITTQTMPKIARHLGVQIGKEPWKYDPIAKLFGVSTKQMASRAYDLSNRSMWWLTDMLAKQRYLEMKDFHPGISNEEAVVKMHDFIDSYVVGPTVGGKGDGGRTFKKFMSDPSASLFGAYHRGLYHSLAKMTSGLLGPRSTMNERVEAAGQWAVAAAMMYGVYPALSYAYSQLTGDKHSEFERRGVSRLLGTVGDVSSGKKDVRDVWRNVWTPSTPASGALAVVNDMDWKGKPIISAQNFREPRKFVKMVGQTGEFAAQQLVSPYKTISAAAQRPGATPGSVAQHFAESNFGLKTPSAAANKHDAQLPKLQARDARQREKHPGGVLESLTNWATKRRYD